MTDFDYLCASIPSFNPGVPSDGEASVPFEWEITFGTPPDAPFGMVRERRDEWWNGWKTLSVTNLAIEDGSFGSGTVFSFPMHRRKPESEDDVSEHDLRRPGITPEEPLGVGPFQFRGSQRFDGIFGPPESSAEAIFIVNFFQPLYLSPGGIWYPSVNVQGLVSYFNGSTTYTNEVVQSTVGTAFEASFCAAHGGGTLDMDVTGTEGPSSLSLTITPTLWFSWGGTRDPLSWAPIP